MHRGLLTLPNVAIELYNCQASDDVRGSMEANLITTACKRLNKNTAFILHIV